MGDGTWSSNVLGCPPPTVRVEGPYGGPGFARGHCNSLVLVGGGIGLTPLARLWQHPPVGISRVELVWVVRCPEAIDWLLALLPSCLEEGSANNGSIHVYVTREATRLRQPALTWAAGVTPRDAILTEVTRARASTNNVELSVSPRNLQTRSQPPLLTQQGASSSWHAGHQNSSTDILQLGEDGEQEQRETSWVAAQAACHSELASLAAKLSWEPEAGPSFVRPHFRLQAGKPDLPTIFHELGQRNPGAVWGAHACGPQKLVDDVRSCAFAQGFIFHTEEFAW